MFNYMGAGEIALIIIAVIVGAVAFSALGALILWGLARGLGKIENATYLNSWGLYWILALTSNAIEAVFVVIALMVMSPALFYILIILAVILSITAGLFITKAFWKCTLKQSFMTHLIPIILIYIIPLIIMAILIPTSSESSYDYYDEYYEEEPSYYYKGDDAAPDAARDDYYYEDEGETYYDVYGRPSQHISRCSTCGISYTVETLPYMGEYCSQSCCVAYEGLHSGCGY